MNAGSRSRAFSLIEVIIAVGIFAGAVAVIIGLMGPLSRQAADSADFLAAQRLPEPVKSELTRLAGADLDSLGGQVPVMSTPLTSGLALVAPRDATRVTSRDLPPATGQIPDTDQYYLIECWKFPNDPLRFDSTKAFLALHVRVSWPYRVPGTNVVVPEANRSQFTFSASLNR